MENFSESDKGGRPRLLHPKIEDVYRAHGKSFACLRTIHNVHYHMRALKVLGLLSDPRPEAFRWLYDPNKLGIRGVSERRGFRSTILSELGRFADDERMRLYAEFICTRKPKTQDAVRMIRRWRLETSPE